jgi:hypothetical protein
MLVKRSFKLKKAITPENRDIKRAPNFTYLGSNESEDGGTAKNIDIRIGAFSILRRIWQSTFIPKTQRLKSLMHVSNLSYCIDAKRGWLQAVSKENFNPLSTDVCATF